MIEAKEAKESALQNLKNRIEQRIDDVIHEGYELADFSIVGHSETQIAKIVSWLTDEWKYEVVVSAERLRIYFSKEY